MSAFDHLPPEERWRAMNPDLVRRGIKPQWSGGGGQKTFDNPQGKLPGTTGTLAEARAARRALNTNTAPKRKSKFWGTKTGFNPQHQYGKTAAQKQQDYQAAKANLGNVGYLEGLKSLAPYSNEHMKNFTRVAGYNRGDRSQFQKIWDGQKLGGYSFGTDDFMEGMDKYYQMDNRTRNREILQPFSNTFHRKDSPHYNPGYRF